MPSLYQRVAARGYASGVVAGQTNVTGAAASEAVNRPSKSLIDAPVSTLTGFQPEGPPPPAVEILEGTWGLPGELSDPLSSPGYGPGTVRTHAAPAPGWAGGYSNFRVDNSGDLEKLHENSRAIHSADFGMPARLTSVLADNVPQQPVDHWESNRPDGGMGTGQVPLTGAQRVLGGMDAVQGYDRRNRYGFDAGHRSRDSYPGYQDRTGGQPMAYLDPAERPFIVPQAQPSFTPTDAVQGPEPWVSDLHAENLNYHDPSAYAPPAEPATLQAPLPVEAPVGGWR